ncbi:MAG: hypothetical protein ROZ36_19690 [Thermincola sp.]|nr:hypothetical protein [Thermincola sp.]
MQGKFILTLLLHIVGLTFLLLPNHYQGPVVAGSFGLHLRTLDLAGIGLIILGTVFLNIYLFAALKKQMSEINQGPPKKELEKSK